MNRLKFGVVAVLWISLCVVGCQSSKPDTQGRYENVESITVSSQNPPVTVISVLTRQGDKVILVNMKVTKVEIVDDVKGDKKPFVDYIQVGDTVEYKTATFHVRNLNEVVRMPGDGSK